ncbi:5-dehydro-4-deoxyglucarate dehydratase [Nesterenkonia sp. HG001]|uniref:5-dehydro-4-deoxyglucarate dehydratase n=1 Tax=Nesterenkonia sp. HG001 TaxID=2983207 RepID=UPI002AC6D736|nr:5-dehydro-4-deoxyglucarate dehydratase [Nesterenkonia sp. HG001]MDZ5077175.1 5-dehydro-4-deoxyglucarate dehydratase [Nesterenkonia sp. HG001]
MSRPMPAELAQTLADGLLSFPVTPFSADLAVDRPALIEHLQWQSSYDVAGLFVAGGTGEGFSLSLAEHAEVTAAAVQAVSAGVPVISSAAGNTAQAVEMARQAEQLGADGILLMPPYLTEASQAGLEAHVSAVLRATRLGVIVYHRANARYSAQTVARLAATHENLIGFKDGIGDLEHLATVRSVNGDRLFYLGGLPTAETFALPLLQMGVSTYSSAMFNFVPEFALGFYSAVRRQDHGAVQDALDAFVLPYLEIRDREKGHGVSIIKAGLRAVGRDAGPVRPPLRDLDAQEQAQLEALILDAAPMREALIASSDLTTRPGLDAAAV